MTTPAASASGAQHTSRLPIRRGPCRVASRQLVQDLAERYPTRAEQHEGVEPQVGDLLDDAPVALTAERRRDPLGRLFADLPARRGLARRQQAGDVRPGGPGPLPLIDRALDPLEHARRSRAGLVPRASLERGEEARALPGVAGPGPPGDRDQDPCALRTGLDGLWR